MSNIDERSETVAGSPGGRATVQSLGRAFVVLGLVAANEQSLGVSELARKADLPKSTTARLLQALTEVGALEREADATFRIGPAIGALLTGSSGSVDLLRQLAWPQLASLSDSLGEHSAVAVTDGGDVLYIAQSSAPNAVEAGDWTDVRHPPHASAFGLALMTGWSPKRIARYLSGSLPAYTDSTVVDPNELRNRLEVAANDGVVWTINELDEDITGIAAPVSDEDDNVVAAIGMFAPSYRFPGELPHKDVERLVRSAAQEMSRNLGWA